MKSYSKNGRRLRTSIVKAALLLALACAVAGPALAAAPAKAKGHAVTKPAKAVTVPGGVRIAGIRVGGLAPGAAASAVRSAFATPIPLVIDGAHVMLHPAKLATAYVDPAIGHARAASSGTNVHLVVSVHGAAVRQALASLSRRFDQKPRDAQLKVKDGRPFVAQEQVGVTVDQKTLLERIVRSLTSNTRRPLSVKTHKVAPAVTAQSFGPMILINREANRLTLFRPNNTVWRVFPVATGQSIYPTPAGRFSIVVKWVDPTWYPPTQDAWAAGLSPVPPGPDNPLGTRWMGLSAPGIGIHGTDEP
ncbi:MAG TPA: L,D-transpeptidase/peptidoglycan binding protein, partial [Gaiellaceae bacterium]|nr:L,D-transpeptidase/peptidoglycan binding protein [Gaiellaceae bacterium]